MPPLALPVSHANRYPLRLFVYLPVCKENRFAAFHTYHHLQNSLLSKNDARCRERAKTITEAAIRPFYVNLEDSGGFYQAKEMSVADIGGGTGELGRFIFERLFQGERHPKNQISWEIVDVDFKNFHRHLSNKKIGTCFRAIKCKRQDMRAWLGSKQKVSCDKSYDLILLCRIINNLSDYTIMGTSC